MIKNILASVAAAGLVFAPLAAQANTRAGDAGVSMEGLARSGAPVGEVENAGAGIPMWLLILLFGAAGVGIVMGVESGENNESPGT